MRIANGENCLPTYALTNIKVYVYEGYVLYGSESAIKICCKAQVKRKKGNESRHAKL